MKAIYLVVFIALTCVGCKKELPTTEQATILIQEDTVRIEKLLKTISDLKNQIREDEIYQKSLQRNLQLAIDKIENCDVVVNLDDTRCNCEVIHQEDAAKGIKVYTIRCDSSEQKVFKYYTRNSKE